MLADKTIITETVLNFSPYPVSSPLTVLVFDSGFLHPNFVYIEDKFEN